MRCYLAQRTSFRAGVALPKPSAFPRRTFSTTVSRIAVISLSPPELDGRPIVNTSTHVVFGILFGVGYGVACDVDLGLGTMVTKTAITNHTATSVFDWFYLGECIGSARSFFHGVCSNSPVPLLRPTAAQNTSSRRSALPCGSRVWHQWRSACQSVTLACPHFCPCNFCVLDNDCVGRVTGVAEQESGTDWRAVAELPPPKSSAFPGALCRQSSS
jgi:hypothetical protein